MMRRNYMISNEMTPFFSVQEYNMTGSICWLDSGNDNQIAFPDSSQTIEPTFRIPTTDIIPAREVMTLSSGFQPCDDNR